ncbi:Rrf2 family transcriptional regulator [Loigolactobacillus backii]|uniref:Transcriptional regulator n=1 Tax=Loigolactobacillus backii TaxID=375175 RepID=A0A192H095_9LACO|nr:Rrf2 family transcriptional regulator [Loigolactobacillus backii]ANK58942.1 transcriptional regulator [Loigolactobacillus backii]ANK61386.1 transcriptional regulator [Loigolactobacillus backii]ANK63930.1 transcriptional regulator [Loigolactobacillus backii]ANK66378.1 transcriptional regulator [Loigolactobacillus backii]ANK69414.1 transcriptional regulator [Loigolactobacillus backii]
MKYSHKLSDAIHILAYLIIYKDGDLSSKAIAASIEANASVVRNLMSDLRKAGLINTQPGSATTTLNVMPNKISILSVYQAINMDHDLLHIDPKTNPQCIVGGNIQDTLNMYYADIEESAFQRMNEITLQDITDDILARQATK